MLAIMPPAVVLGHAQYMNLIPNGHHIRGKGALAWHAVGHISPDPRHHVDYLLGGFGRNHFGADFKAAKYMWTKALCLQDSDGDGASNGQELGDPHCVWRVGLEPARSYNLSHPGMAPPQLESWSHQWAHLEERKHTQWLTKANRAHPDWPSPAVSTRTFTSPLFYYQHVVIPFLVASAIALSCGVCTCGGGADDRGARARRCRCLVRRPPFPKWLGVFAMYYLLFIVGVGLGVHRYWSHKSYTATKPLKLFLAFLALFVGQGGPLDWAYVHRLHHRICEHELDYHSPHPVEARGFWYAQAAWMITPHEHVVRSPALEALICGDIVHDPDLAFFHYVCGTRAINKALLGMVAPGFTLCAGYLFVHALRERRHHRQGLEGAKPRTACELLASAFCFTVYYFYLPVALTWMSTGFVNSATHIWGDAPFADSMMAGCEARNNALLMFPMLGENWHNNHHAAPGSLSTWVLWYQIDFVYLTGRLLELLGLASDLRVEVPHTRLQPEQPHAAFPAALWTGWAVVFALVWRWKMAPVNASEERSTAKTGERELLMEESQW